MRGALVLALCALVVQGAFALRGQPQAFWLPPAFSAPVGAPAAQAPMQPAQQPAMMQPGVPMGNGGAPMGGAAIGSVPAARAAHPYAAPFPSAPYTSMYSMSPQAYYSFLQTTQPSAYRKVRNMQAKRAAELAQRTQ